MFDISLESNKPIFYQNQDDSYSFTTETEMAAHDIAIEINTLASHEGAESIKVEKFDIKVGDKSIAGYELTVPADDREFLIESGNIIKKPVFREKPSTGEYIFHTNNPAIANRVYESLKEVCTDNGIQFCIKNIESGFQTFEVSVDKKNLSQLTLNGFEYKHSQAKGGHGKY